MKTKSVECIKGMEVRCAKRTVESEIKVCGMYKNSRVELGCAKMTVENESKVCAMHKKAEWTLDGQK